MNGNYHGAGLDVIDGFAHSLVKECPANAAAPGPRRPEQITMGRNACLFSVSQGKLSVNGCDWCHNKKVTT